MFRCIMSAVLQGYWSSGSFIAAQGPMPDTVVDFLHMLYQKRVKTVFMLTDCTENEKVSLITSALNM